MFGSSLRTFEEDPFFRDFHETHQRMMGGIFPNSFGNAFGNSFGASPYMLMDGNVHPTQPVAPPQGREIRSMPRRMDDPWGQAMSPFGSFGMMDSMFRSMNDNFERMASDPSSHSYSHSSVMSFSNSGQGAPQYYEATHSTKSVPGGVKEETRSVRDSMSGTQKMSVQRQIGDRSHTIEKSKDVRSGDMEENQDFVNLDETDAARFEQEFRDRTSSRHSRVGYAPVGRRPTHAITDGRSQSYRDQNRRFQDQSTRPHAPSKGKRPQKSDLHEI